MSKIWIPSDNEEGRVKAEFEQAVVDLLGEIKDKLEKIAESAGSGGKAR